MPTGGIGDLPEYSNSQGDFAHGSRTQVTNLPGFQSYRFFATFAAELLHAPVFQHIFLSSIPLLEAIWPWNGAFGLFANAPWGHTWDTVERSGRRMLLSLCGIAFAGWLRQDVPRESPTCGVRPIIRMPGQGSPILGARSTFISDRVWISD